MSLQSFPSQLTANDLTGAIDYQLTKKYEMIFTESYDFGSRNGNILTSPDGHSKTAAAQRGRHRHL